MYILKHAFFLILLLVFQGFAIAQDTPPDSTQVKQNTPDSLRTENRSQRLQALDSLQRSAQNDSLRVANDSIPPSNKKGDIDTTVKYSAEDSINFSVDNRIVNLYGDARINYGDITLEAERIIINYEDNTLTAYGVEDSTGRMIGKPIFEEGLNKYQTTRMVYNFQTRRAYIQGVVTTQGEGFMHGHEVKKTEENDLYIKNARYTTCNLGEPHFDIFAPKLKVIPGDKVVSGPFIMRVNKVLTPLGFVFGMFPSSKNRSSGVIFPSYGEERRRGFFISNGGYFWAINDYVNLAVTGNLYSKGSYGLRAGSTYRKRYKYNGNMVFNFTNTKTDETEANQISSRDFSLTWSHTPQNIGRSSRFSVNVNARSNSFAENNFNGVESNITAQLSSSVSYSKTFTGTPFSMSLNSRFNQNLSTKAADLQLPELSVNMANRNPFLGKGKSPRTWYEKIVIRWAMRGTNRISNTISSDSIAPINLETLPKLFKNARRGFTHNIPVSTSMKLLKFFTLTPNVNYTERWYFERLNYSYDEVNDVVVEDTVRGFQRVYDFSTGASLATRIYGTLNFTKGRIKAIRHVINPNISFSYRPDFGKESFGYYESVRVNAEGDEELRNRYRLGVFGSPGQGRSGNIGLSVSNNLEMKVQPKNDTTNTTKKVTILNNLAFSTAYNIFAEQFKLSNINFSTNTVLFNRLLNVAISGSIDPYIYVLNAPITFNAEGERVVSQSRINEFAWNNGQGLGQLRSLRLSFNTSLNPKSFQASSTPPPNNPSQGPNSGIGRPEQLTDPDLQYIEDNPNLYVDFSIPWNLRTTYSINRTKTGFQDPRVIQSLRFSGDLRLTKNTIISFNSGYDFEQKDFTTTSINITRNLHCWEMLFSWVPFGNFESFEFTIRAKSSILQDLKLNRRRSFFDVRN